MASPSPLFRQEALDHLAAPPGTRERLRLVRPADRAALVGLGLVVLLGAVWLVFGRVAVRVDGAGILLTPRALVSGADGSPLSAAVLATMSQPALLQQRDQLTARVEAARARDAQSDTVWAEELALQRASVERQIAELDARIDVLEGLARTQQQAAARLAALRHEQLRQQESEAEEMRTEREVDVAALAGLGPGVVAHRDRTAARADALVATQTLAEIRESIAGLPLEAVEVARLRDELTASRDEARAARDAAALRLLTLTRTDAERRALARDALAVLSNQLDAVSLALERQRATVSGAPASDADPLLVVLFMDAADAKRVAPGMEIRVSPDSVERARYGSVLGTVSEVSDYPVTPEQADALLANPSLAQTLAGGGRHVLVVARLSTDASTPTGFRWTTSEGPPGALTPGTTLIGSVTVESRRPITWMLPALRGLLSADP